MDIVKAKFPNGLPTLAELKANNSGKGVPPETAWIWGEDDEVCKQNRMIIVGR
jgi:hypothetical protein